MEITVVPYDVRWPALFAEEAARLKAALGENCLCVYHIGSTSVPGLAAKPIIDLLPVVADLAAVDDCRPALEALGYEYMGTFGIPGRRYLRRGEALRTHQAHIFQCENTADILRHLAFSRYLRCHPEVCAAYAALKRELAARHPRDIEAYSNGKDAFVKAAERDALRWYWQQEAEAEVE